MENYKRFLLNRTTVTPVIIDCLENCLTNESETTNQSFHKIMIHNWSDSLGQLCDIISSYYGSLLVPVNCTCQGELTTFYTANLTAILKIIKFDFMFPYCRNMFNIDVLFNDKIATDFFGTMTTVEEIVTGVVSQRFNEKCELDLSDFGNDPEFINKKIWFYKLSLLAQFKILMLRMGRDTKKLILRNNNLSQPPVDILNFFIKADLTAIDLSHNNIPSLQDLQRVSSKIEKLWIEGNPLCQDLDPITYVKNVSVKFPRLKELDGMQFNRYGILVPFIRNYLAKPDKRTKTIVEQFVTLYFSNFDDADSACKRVKHFYQLNATLTVSTDFTVNDHKLLPNFYHIFTNPINSFSWKKYEGLTSISMLFENWPLTIHDLHTFTVDVMCHSKTVLMLIIDGIFKHPGNPIENIFQFRRTFMLRIQPNSSNLSTYNILNEMLSIRFATNEQIKNSFKAPIINMNSLTLINPTNEQTEAISKVFQHLTQLKKPEAEL